jgi:hypothetical protein
LICSWSLRLRGVGIADREHQWLERLVKAARAV